MELSEKEWSALRAACDCIIPSIEGAKEHADYWRHSASAQKVPEQIVEVIAQLDQRVKSEFKQLLQLISSRFLGLTWMGPLKPFHKLTAAQQETLLRKWSKANFGLLRNAYQTIKKLTCFYYYGGVGSTQQVNPAWKAIGYDRLENKAGDKIPVLPTVELTGDTELHCDIVVVGSGAGGSVVAAELAKAGHEVIVVEKGKYIHEQNLTNNEAEMFNNLYDSKGFLTSKTGGVTVLAGSCLGGGTTVNWAGAFRTPAYILSEWADQGNPQFKTVAFQKGFDVVEQRNHIGVHPVPNNPQNEALKVGAEKLGCQAKPIARNMKRAEFVSEKSYWDAQGFSPLGDMNGSKQSAQQSFLKDAVDHGAKILVNTTVEYVAVNNGQAKGVVGYQQMNGGRKIHVNIHAKKVVISAGSIHSPAILLRSGLKHPQIGRNLYFHPTIAVSALYKKKMCAWYGPMMSVVIDDFTKLNGNYGFKLETPPAHPGLMAAGMSWASGKQLKADMLNAANTGFFIILTRDQHGGRVFLGKEKEPVIYYALSNFDKNHMIQGIQKATRIHYEAGAEKINIPHHQLTEFHRGKDNIDEFINQIPTLKWEENYYGLYTAHQMGTCRMGGNAKTHPVKPNGETVEIRNLFVADASLFPSASGVNPMLTIQTLAYYVAQQIKTGIA